MNGVGVSLIDNFLVYKIIFRKGNGIFSSNGSLPAKDSVSNHATVWGDFSALEMLN